MLLISLLKEAYVWEALDALAYLVDLHDAFDHLYHLLVLALVQD